MHCHGAKNDNRNGNGKGHKGHVSHILMMVLCCGAPVLILFFIPFLAKGGNSGIAKFLTAVAPFLCPLMMVFMIPMMFKGRKDKTHKADSLPDKQARLEERASGE